VDGQTYIDIYPDEETDNLKLKEGDLIKGFLTEQEGVDFKANLLT
jgi:hypothetical protein